MRQFVLGISYAKQLLLGLVAALCVFWGFFCETEANRNYHSVCVVFDDVAAFP